jgi:hypothetical protein
MPWTLMHCVEPQVDFCASKRVKRQKLSVRNLDTHVRSALSGRHMCGHDSKQETNMAGGI